MSVWVWIAIGVLAWLLAVFFALGLCSVAAAADEARGLQEWQQGEEADDVS